MSEAIIVALITGACAIIANLIISRQSSKELYAKLDKQSELSDANLKGEIAVIRTELNNLATEVHKHNNFADRIPALEEKAKAADRRLTDLEHKKEG